MKTDKRKSPWATGVAHGDYLKDYFFLRRRRNASSRSTSSLWSRIRPLTINSTRTKNEKTSASISLVIAGSPPPLSSRERSGKFGQLYHLASSAFRGLPRKTPHKRDWRAGFSAGGKTSPRR